MQQKCSSKWCKMAHVVYASYQRRACALSDVQFPEPEITWSFMTQRVSQGGCYCGLLIGMIALTETRLHTLCFRAPGIAQVVGLTCWRRTRYIIHPRRTFDDCGHLLASLAHFIATVCDSVMLTDDPWFYTAHHKLYSVPGSTRNVNPISSLA